MQGKCLSSTHAELAAALTFATAFQPFLRKFRSVTWFCDSRNAIARQTSDRTDDPSCCVLRTAGLPRMTWAKGHASNPHINVADAVSTKARGKPEKIDITYCLRAFNVEWSCTNIDFDAVQLDSPVKYVQQVLSNIRDEALRRRILEHAPPEVMDPKKLRALMYVPGACDILQALARRAILPVGTKRSCAVRGCMSAATAEHVLLCDSMRHRQLLTRDAHNDTISGGRKLTLERVLRGFMDRNPAVMLYVCERLLLQQPEDATLCGWCNDLRQWVMLRREYRERNEP